MTSLEFTVNVAKTIKLPGSQTQRKLRSFKIQNPKTMTIAIKEPISGYGRDDKRSFLRLVELWIGQKNLLLER